MRSRVLPWLIFIAIFGVGGMLASDRGWTEPMESLVAAVFAPMQEIISRPAGSVSNSLSGLLRFQDLASENEEQRHEIERLNGEIVRLREQELENQRLRSLLSYKNANGEHELLVADIIGRDPSDLVQSIVINKGAKHGVRVGMVVVAGNGLVGRIMRAFDSSAKVLLIVDPRSSVNAMIQRSRAIGVVSGKSGNQLIMDFLLQGEDVAENDLVVTSGLGGTFPKGILVGQVAAVEGNDLEVFQQLQVTPAVRIDKIEEVMVITNFLPSELP